MQKFEVTILGSGSASPTISRNPSAQLLNIAERFFLIDCGEGTQIQLRKCKLSWSRIDHIFISHLHGDHYLGLLGLLQSMHLLGRKKVMHLFCFPELKEIIDIQNKYSGTELNYEIEYHFLSTNGKNLILEDNKVKVYSFPLNHRIPCCGFLFEEKEGLRKIRKYEFELRNISLAEIHKVKQGMNAIDNDGNEIDYKLLSDSATPTKSYAYCSDTRYDERLVDYIRGATTIYHESTFLKDMVDRAKATFHSTAEEAAKIALASETKQLILGHFSARYNLLEPFLEEAGAVFNNCVLAKDGEIIII